MSIYTKLLVITTIVTLSQNLFSLLLPFVVYEYTQSYGSMTLVKAIEYLPNVTIILLLGSFIDKYGWRINMIVSIVTQGVIIFFLTAIVSLQWNNSVALVAGIFLITSMTVLFNNSRVYAIGHVVEKDQLTQANAFIQAIMQSSQIVAPVLLALFIMLNDMYYGLLFCAGCLSVAAIVILCVRKHEAPHEHVEKESQKFSVATSFLFKAQKPLLKLSIIAAMVNGIESSQIILFIFQAKTFFNLSNFNLGILFSLISIIVIAFCICIGNYKHLFFNKKFFVSIFVLNAFFYIICYRFDSIVVLSLSLLTSSIAFATIAIYVWTYRQLNTPLDILGKVTSITSMIFKFGIPLMMLVSYVITRYIDSVANYLLFSMLCFGIVAMMVWDQSTSRKNRAHL